MSLTDEQQQALDDLEKELRILAKGAAAGADLAGRKVENLDMIEDPRNPALAARFFDLTEMDLRARFTRVERSLAAARQAFAPEPLRVVEAEVG